jgi:UDPglucose 6-dehydrogenase
LFVHFADTKALLSFSFSHFGASGMRIAVVGTGYVGIVSGACLADFGHEVTCVDQDEAKIAGLRRGVTPIYEPGLERLIAKNAGHSRLQFSRELGAIRRADVVFIAVGTPPRRCDGCADLSYVYAAARNIADNLSAFTVIAIKSTVPVGTGDEVEAIVRESRQDVDFAVVSNPEFLREGSAIHDFTQPDRIVIGCEHARARKIMAELYRPLQVKSFPILFTGRRTAELIKYGANALLATKVAFINEMADLCERVGADVTEVAQGIGSDSRIGPRFLAAGPGFGGSCFPKDALALMKTAQDHGAPLRIVETVVSVNETRRRAMARKVAAALGGSVRGKTVAVLGLTFKPDTDDVREAPSITLITALQDLGAKVRAHDPAGMQQAKSLLEYVSFATNPYACAQGADALVIMTEWDQYRTLNFARLKRVMATPVLIDLRNVYAPADVTRHGFVYEGVGRARRTAADAIPFPARTSKGPSGLRSQDSRDALAPSLSEPLLRNGKLPRPARGEKAGAGRRATPSLV